MFLFLGTKYGTSDVIGAMEFGLGYLDVTPLVLATCNLRTLTMHMGFIPWLLWGSTSDVVICFVSRVPL